MKFLRKKTVGLAGPVSRTFVQYLIAFCSRPEVDNDVMSDVAVDYVGMDVHVKFSQKILEIFEGLSSCRTNAHD